MQSPILYSGRALFLNDSKTIRQVIPITIDVRHFIQTPDFYLNKIVKNIGAWDAMCYEEKAMLCFQYVRDNIVYTPDKPMHGIPEFWNFPNETLTLGKGDCEDMAILIVSMMRNAGIPAYRVKVAAGHVAMPTPTAPLGGHAYPMFLREHDEEWVALDPCYMPNNLPIKQRVAIKNDTNYKDIWFTFNDELSWSNRPVQVVKDIKAVPVPVVNINDSNV